MAAACWTRAWNVLATAVLGSMLSPAVHRACPCCAPREPRRCTASVCIPALPCPLPPAPPLPVPPLLPTPDEDACMDEGAPAPTPALLPGSAEEDCEALGVALVPAVPLPPDPAFTPVPVPCPWDAELALGAAAVVEVWTIWRCDTTSMGTVTTWVMRLEMAPPAKPPQYAFVASLNPSCCPALVTALFVTSREERYT